MSPEDIVASNDANFNRPYDEAELRRWLSLRQLPCEIRILNCGKYRTVSGYYDDINQLVDDVVDIYRQESPPAIYTTIQGIKPDLMARSSNKLTMFAKDDSLTKDHHVVQRHWLPIDFDPQRPTGISSTDEEHAASLEAAKKAREYLTSHYWPQPILADSGNGHHLLYALDIPVDSESTTIIQKFYEHLAATIAVPGVKVDTTLFNPSRVLKLYGTKVMKGDQVMGRKHRMSRLLEVPPELLPVSLDKIAALCIPETFSDSTFFDEDPDNNWLTSFLSKHSIETTGPYNYGGGEKWKLRTCPLCGESDKSAVIVRKSEGPLAYKCHHNRCVGKTWRDLRLHYEPDAYKSKDRSDELDKVFSSDSDTAPAPEEKPKKNHFDQQAQAFVKAMREAGQYPVYSGGRMYFYAGTKYVLVEELPMVLRQYFISRKWSQSNNVIGNVVQIVQSLCWKDIARYGSLPMWIGAGTAPFDRRNIITFQNGLLDLSTGNLLPHTSDWCNTFCLPFAYKPDAACITWEKFLHEVFEGDKTRIALLQEFFGYCLTQDTSLQKLLCLVGKPRSGKGTIQRILVALVGKDSATGFSLDRLVSEFGASALVGKTVAIIGEVELQGVAQRSRIVETLKDIVGEGEVSINVKFDPQCRSQRLPTRFVIATNTVPRLMDSSGAMAARLLFLPFQLSFLGREDTDLEQKLLNELPGIANWALEGLKRLRANNGKFSVGESSRSLSSQFTAETSPTLGWVKQRTLVSSAINPGDLPSECITDKLEVSVIKDEAYADYRSWCEEWDVAPTTLTWFCRDLKTILPKLKEQRIKSATGIIRSYRGLMLAAK